MTSPKYTSLEEIDEIYNTLSDSFRSGKTKSIEFRKDALLRFAYMFSDNIYRFVDTLKEDMGRPILEGLFCDAQTPISEAMWAYKNIDTWIQPEPVDYHPAEAIFNPVMQKVPKGVGLIISAYNYPLFTMRGMAGAIAAGCPVILKPSELLPATSALLAELFHKYLDPSAYRVVLGGVEETTELLTKRWGHLLFVGSNRVGAIVASAAGKTLTPVTLELGGKCPCFVHSSADMDAAAKRILWGRMLNAGQTCLSPDFVVLLEKDKDIFMTALLKTYNEFYGTVHPKNTISLLKPGTTFERASRSFRTKATFCITLAVGTIVAGGEIDAKEKYMAPTIVKDVDWDDSLMEQEIFGPILPIVVVPNYEVAIQKIQQRGEPLVGYSFHQDDKFGDYIRDSILTGTWTVNDTVISHGGTRRLAASYGIDILSQALTTPCCGVGTSGTGRGYKGKTSFMEFTHLRPCYTVPDLDVAANLHVRYPPYTDEKYETMKMLNPQIDVPRPAGI